MTSRADNGFDIKCLSSDCVVINDSETWLVDLMGNPERWKTTSDPYLRDALSYGFGKVAEPVTDFGSEWMQTIKIEKPRIYLLSKCTYAWRKN